MVTTHPSTSPLPDRILAVRDAAEEHLSRIGIFPRQGLAQHALADIIYKLNLVIDNGPQQYDPRQLSFPF